MMIVIVTGRKMNKAKLSREGKLGAPPKRPISIKQKPPRLGDLTTRERKKTRYLQN